MATVRKWSNVAVAMQSAIAADVTITGISKASEGVVTLRSYPFQLLSPAVAISLTMLGFNFFGDGLRDALDPRMRR